MALCLAGAATSCSTTPRAGAAVAAVATATGTFSTTTLAPAATTAPTVATTVAPTTTPPTTAAPTTTTVPGLTAQGAAVPVVDVVDGDTLKVLLGGVRTTIRVIGLDTPETKDPRKPVQCYGPQASARAHQLLDGQTVRVSFDASQGRTDKYGRTLAYVWLPNGQSYEELMIDQGYGHEYTYDTPYQYQSQFRAAQADAEAHTRGLWSPSTCNGNTDQLYSTPPTAASGTPGQQSGGTVYYANCAAARAAGVAPLHRGDPGYRSGLDRDDDGVACE